MTKAAFGEYLVKHLLEFFHEFKAAGEGANAQTRLRGFTSPLWATDILKSQVRDDCNQARHIIEGVLVRGTTCAWSGVVDVVYTCGMNRNQTIQVQRGST